MPKQTPLMLLTKEKLTDLYHGQNLSQGVIAKQLGVTQGAIFCRMKQWGIIPRTKASAIRIGRATGRYSGANNPAWKGGRHIGKSGYVFVRHPGAHASYRGYIREHILVWETANGPLPKGWHIHHKNGVKTDNRLKNLEAMQRTNHALVIPNLQKRIAELEVENERLKFQLASLTRRRAIRHH